jgi:hypothetical protein
VLNIFYNAPLYKLFGQTCLIFEIEKINNFPVVIFPRGSSFAVAVSSYDSYFGTNAPLHKFSGHPST